jgi:ABC-type uncharacterized transport system permease subunit
MIPLTLVAFGWILATSARRISIGFEGQILIGGTVATVVAIELHTGQRWIHLPLALLAGAAGGAAWAALPALLRAFRHVDELITTFLLNFVAALLVNYLIRGPLQESTHTLVQSADIPASAASPRFGTTALTWDVLFIPLALTVFVFVLRRTTTGFRLRVVSDSEATARHVGIGVGRIGALALVVSGALAGLAGSSLILSSPTGVLQDNFSAHYGFDGIAVALLARNSPLGCIPAALLFAALREGGGMVEAQVGVSTALADVAQGLIIVLVAGSALLLRLHAFRRPGARLRRLQWDHSTLAG